MSATRSWRRLLCALITVLASFVAPTAHAADPIRLWHAYRGEEQKTLERIVADSGLAVELLAVPYDAFGSKLAASIPLGEGPHLFVDAHERLGDYRARALVAAFPEATSTNAYAQNARVAVEFEGRVWGLPVGQKSLALFINTDLVAEAPADLESIASLQENLPEGVFALAYEARLAYAHATILHAFGASMLIDDDQFGMRGEAAVRSLEFARSMLDSGAVPEDADGALVTSLFRSGRAATAISGPWLLADLSDGPNFRVMRLPTIRAADGERMRPFLTVETVMLSPQGARRADVVALAEILASAESARRRLATVGTLPARLDVAVPDDNDTLRAFAAQAATAVPMPTSSAMRAVWEPANRAIRKVLNRELEAHAALEEATRRFVDVRRPPPPARSPAPLLFALGMLSLTGAGWFFVRMRDPALRRRIRRSVPAYKYLAHGIVAVGVLVLLPMAVGAGASLFAGQPHQMHYVGLANYGQILTARGGELLGTGSFYLVLLVTVAWTVSNVVLHLTIGVSLGLVLSRPLMRLRGIYRVLLIIPWAVPSYVTALAWRGMFHRQFGAVTGLIEGLNDLFGTSIEPIYWFARFSTAFAANLVTNVWLGFPFMMVVTLGALTAIPNDVLEAAKVDGASRMQTLRSITLPIIGPALAPAITLGAIWTFNMFNVVFLVSGGEPDGTTDILISEAYRWAFTREAQYGYAAAYAVLIFLMLLGASRVSERVLGERGSLT